MRLLAPFQRKGERTVQVRIGGRKYPITSDDDYLRQVGGTFEPDMVRLLRALVRPGDLALDVGANIGCTAILLGALARRVIAFEPSPTTFRFLEKNIAACGLGNIEIANVALGARRGDAKLTMAPNNRAGAFVSGRTQASAGHVTEAIEIRTADELGLGMADFLKLDVEGFEGQVLAGAARLLRESKPVAVLELNHWCLNALQRTSVPDYLDQLRAIFPVLLAVDGRRYADLHDPSASYRVMYDHIVGHHYPNLVGAFDRGRLAGFFEAYRPAG